MSKNSLKRFLTFHKYIAIIKNSRQKVDRNYSLPTHKGGDYMADIIIKDGNTGATKSFAPTREGYAAAQAAVDTITQQGHTVQSSDLGRIGSFFGTGSSSGSSTGSSSSSDYSNSRYNL